LLQHCAATCTAIADATPDTIAAEPDNASGQQYD